MRVVVIGGGVIGLLTAVECVRLGAQVSLVEQADLPSPIATSHDRLRVVRALHRGDPELTTAAARAQERWVELERELGARFFHRVGSVTAMPAGEAGTEFGRLSAAGVVAGWLGPGDLSTRYPAVRFPAGVAAVAEPEAGVVRADLVLAALVRWLRAQPTADLYARRQVLGIDPDGAVRLRQGAVLVADRVVVAAGPWSRDLLPASITDGLTLYRQSVLSYRPVPNRAAWAGTPAIPRFGTADGAWLVPPVAGSPVRLSAASACRAVTELTDRETPPHWREHLIDVFRTRLTGFDPEAVIGATDGYYLADDRGPGPRLASYGNGVIWAYAACGGMSFKFAPLVARALADRALGRQPHDTGLAAVDRPRADRRDLVPSPTP